MKVQIQYNGSTIALAIADDANETKEETLNRFINHGAIDPKETESIETLPDGSFYVKTSLRRFKRGIAAWQQFKSGIEIESERTRAFFAQRAERFLASLPVGNFARFYRL